MAENDIEAAEQMPQVPTDATNEVVETQDVTRQVAELEAAPDTLTDELEVSHTHAGRPTKYEPGVVGKLLAAFQRDMTVTEACHYAGINPDTHYEWLKKYPEYSEKVDRARTYLFRKAKEVVAEEVIGKDGIASRWFLGKRHADYNPRTHVELSGGLEVNQDDSKLVEILERMKANTNTDGNTADSPTDVQPGEQGTS